MECFLKTLLQSELGRVCRENIRCLRAMSEASGISRHSDKHAKQIRGEYRQGLRRTATTISSTASPPSSIFAAVFVTALGGLAYAFLDFALALL